MENNRRDALKNIALSAAAVGALVGNPIALRASKIIGNCDCLYPNMGANAEYFSNAIVLTHDRGKKMFYNDLLFNKVVMVNFMSIESEKTFGSTKKLIEVQNILGSRLGQDYYIYSITTDPINDTVDRLRAFALENGVENGWSFLTSSAEIIDGIKQRFFYTGPSSISSHHNGKDCSQGLMRYGNENVGLWGSVPHSSPSDWIVKRLEWVAGSKNNSDQPMRKGPRVIVKGKPWLYDSGNFNS